MTTLTRLDIADYLDSDEDHPLFLKEAERNGSIEEDQHTLETEAGTKETPQKD